MLDVHAGDVVGQQHHFVAVQLGGELARQRGARDLAHDAHDEVAGADKGVDDVYALAAEGAAELALEDGGDAAHHEVDDRLRCVDDAVRVGHLDREALEELLVDSVEELLLVREVADGGGSALDGDVEVVQAFEELVAAEGLRGERVDDAGDLVGNDVAAGEVGVVEDGAEEAFGEHVLDQHLLDGGFGKGRVDGLAAFLQELGEGGGEALVGPALLPDQLGEALADLRDPLFELGDRLLPGGVLLRAVAEEDLQRLDQLRRVGEVGVERQAPVLPEHGPARRLEEDVVARVAGRELALDLGGQVVVFVLGLPVAVREVELVDQGAVNDDASAGARVDGVLGHEGPAELAGAVFEQGLEGGAHGGLAGDVEVGEAAEGGVVVFDGLVAGFEVESRHGIYA